MIISYADALHWTGIIEGCAIFFQTLELIAIRKSVRDDGVWAWSAFKEDFFFLPKAVRFFLEALLSYPGFILVLSARAVSALLMTVTLNPIVIGIVFISTLLIALRWRGSFNGGSDFMNLIVLSALGVASASPENPAIQTACLWYIAIQTCTSYFIAGIIKVRRGNWRNGNALAGFMSTTIYSPDPWAEVIAKSPILPRIASWSAITFECAFPVALLSPAICIFMMSVGLMFHLANFYLFGLNRFVLSWAAAYPALLYITSRSQ